MRKHVLDANALLRLILDNPGAEIVADVLKQAGATNTEVMMSIVTWGEVYYTMARRVGIGKTDQIMSSTLDNTGLQLVGVDRENISRIARLKAQYDVPYADCFAAELAGTQNVLVTADVSHFERVPKLRLLKLPSHKRS